MAWILALLWFAQAGDAARELARKVIAGLGGREAVAVTFRNLSSLPPAEAEEIRKSVEQELRGRGEPRSEARVTLSENPTAYLLVAEARSGVYFAWWPRSGAAPRQPPSMSIEKKLIVEQSEPILDAVALDDGRAVVLEPGKITIGGQTVSVPAHVWPRDSRGMLAVTPSGFDAFLPGAACHGALFPEISMSCRDSDEPWPVGARLAPGRNYFTAPRLPPFYSVAGALLSPVSGPAFPGWGSDIALMEGCSARTVLASRAGAGADAIQGFDVTSGRPVPVTPPVEFAGPVTALWMHGSNATAVARETGRYAAYNLALRCAP